LHSYSLGASQGRALAQLNQRKSITSLDPALTIAIILKPFKIEFWSKETFSVRYDVVGCMTFWAASAGKRKVILLPFGA
jgi:hypothetical protein